MNRALRMQHLRRCALKNTRGGGLEVDPSTSFFTSNGVPIPENLPTTECYDPTRPGSLVSPGNPELAQVAMAGGGYREAVAFPSARRLNSLPAAGGNRRRKSTHRRNRKGFHPLFRKSRKQRGGRYEVDVSSSVGGTGPVAAPVYSAVPCDPQAGSSGPFYVPLPQDPRAPSDLYSVTPNQSGGRAPGSEMPVYPATSAGFQFAPSTEAGATLPDGVTAYNEVIPYVARMGGAHRRRRRDTRRNKCQSRR